MPLDLAGSGVYIDASEGRIGTGARHQADGPGTWAEELGARVDQHVLDGEGPALWNALECYVMGEAHQNTIRAVIMALISLLQD